MINVKKSVFSCLLVCGSLNLSAQNAYDVIELGNLDDNLVFAYSINNSNTIAGFSYTTLIIRDLNGTILETSDAPNEGFSSKDGVITGLGAIDNPNVSRSVAFSISDSGIVSGYSLQAKGSLNIERATYTNTSLDIGLVPPFVIDDNQNMRALASNIDGLVVGFGEFDPTDDVDGNGASKSIRYNRGFIYDSVNDLLTRIDPFDYQIDKSQEMTLRDINQDGIAVGVSLENGVNRIGQPVKFNSRSVYIDTAQNSTLIDMSLSESNRSSAAFAINDNKFVVGKRNIGANVFLSAYIYNIDNQELIDLPELRTGYRPSTTSDISIPYDINDTNQVVGTALADVVPDLFHAFIYENGTMKDLNNLIDCKMDSSQAAVGEPDWVLFEARSINDDGIIVGNGYFNNRRKAFMLVPRIEAPVLCPVAEAKKGSGSVPLWLSSMLILIAVFRKKLIN